jgi:hypothetical protein
MDIQLAFQGMAHTSSGMFKSSLDYLSFLIQCKCYINGCLGSTGKGILFRIMKRKKSVHAEYRCNFLKIVSIHSWLNHTGGIHRYGEPKA